MKSRLVLAAVMASVLSIGMSSVAAADSVGGQVGHYIFNDGNTTDTAGGGCRYAQSGPGTWSIFRMAGRPPSVWWMNTNSDITTQHGTVRWRLIVRHKAQSSDTWSVLKKSSWQYRTAYEDQVVPYGNSTKAPFTTIVVDVAGTSFEVSHQFRLTARVEWLRRDGTVKGYATHDVQYYRELIEGTLYGVASNPWCIDAYQAA